MILIEGQIEAIRTRKDRTWAITLGTQELTPDKAAKVMSVNQKADVYCNQRRCLYSWRGRNDGQGKHRLHTSKDTKPKTKRCSVCSLLPG
jgi:hypothetical protein